MGHYARISAGDVGLADYDAAQLAQDAPVWNVPPGAPRSGCAQRNGKPIPFTLEPAGISAKSQHLLPEQMIIAGLLIASFVVPILHLFG